MEWRVLLRYPNGRVHVASVASADPVRAGFEFDLYGRRWRATGELGRAGGPRGAEGMLCVLVAAAGEAARGSERTELRP